MPGPFLAIQRPHSASDVSAADGPAPKRLRPHSARTTSSLRPRLDPEPPTGGFPGLPGSAAGSPSLAPLSAALNGLSGAALGSPSSAAGSPGMAADAAHGFTAGSAAPSPTAGVPSRRLSSHGLASQLEVLHMPQLPPWAGGQSQLSGPATGARASHGSPAVADDIPLSPAVDAMLHAGTAGHRSAEEGAHLAVKAENPASSEPFSGQHMAASMRPSPSVDVSMAEPSGLHRLQAQPDAAAAFGASAAAEAADMRDDGAAFALEASAGHAVPVLVPRQDELVEPSAASASEQVRSHPAPSAFLHCVSCSIRFWRCYQETKTVRLRHHWQY